MAYFYRRKSGRFYARIRVPEALQPHFSTQELRRSLNTTDRALACHLALAAALQWKAEFARLSGDMDLEKLSAGSPLLLSVGTIKLADAAIEMGLSVPELFDQFKTRKLGLSVLVSGSMGVEVPELIFDDSDSVVDVWETIGGRQLKPIHETLRLRRESVAITEGGTFTDCVFYRVTGKPVVLSKPMQKKGMDAPPEPFDALEVPIGDLLVDRADCERVRQRLAATITPAMREAARPAPAPAPNTDVIETMREAALEAAMGEAYKHRGMQCSALLEAFYKEKKWSAATIEKNRRFHGLFVELMGNPVLGNINRELMRSFREAVEAVPCSFNTIRREDKPYHGLSIHKLVETGKRDGLELIGAGRAGEYVAKIGGAFNWAVANGFMRLNPASGLAQKNAAKVREKDKRQPFDAAMLGRIFSQDLWRDGRGKVTKKDGKHREFSPFKYWTPLLALYSGARRGELAQLYVKDVKQTEKGTWYLDFNLEGEGKKEAEREEGQNDKQLKTVNAIRVIALHPELVRLGFVEYVQALRDAGHARVFPELAWDPVKGYGRYVGRWFNDKIMKGKLGVERDGTLSFHSFRHTFITACVLTGMGDAMRDDLAGHAPVGSQGVRTYAHLTPDKHLEALSRVRFDLPAIGVFDVYEGMQSLADAIERNDGLRTKKAKTPTRPRKA
ncbi:MAG: site-specific integrase [Comamonas sp.]